ncbi:hypothetical protein GCE9029_01074 [Grimontia celer]|uniref:Uncharacterized protein n=1 Tax=Grimontia celer TaxID=1796497 RepID=A0A128EXC5_9GAMM|nr:hypothetical protein GCE9029_01074 [Grimontia celer]
MVYRAEKCDPYALCFNDEAHIFNAKSLQTEGAL